MTRNLFHVPVSNETLRVMAASMHCLGTTIPLESGVAFDRSPGFALGNHGEGRRTLTGKVKRLVITRFLAPRHYTLPLFLRLFVCLCVVFFFFLPRPQEANPVSVFLSQPTITRGHTNELLCIADSD